jgi:hypothetical protein
VQAGAKDLSAREKREDPFWHVYLTVAIALVLQVILPERLAIGPKYLLPGLETGLFAVLVATAPRQPKSYSFARRALAISVVALTSFANAASVLLLVRYLLKGGKAEGEELLIAAINIFFTNIIVFGLWYWEIDAGGPMTRYLVDVEFPDFLFPQYDVTRIAPPDWRPTFVDYLYVSLTNATAFSPTDTLPLTHRAKLLMGFQALISLLTIAMVAARAVNILS